ncbi:MAG TPA: hypothetical protein VD884_01100 [Ohtaekwangia sp.]|nr:hypothetical protein [Ohtaekwangia sp.]
MNAFFEENRHFISIKIHKEMRSLTEDQRLAHYERDLKSEVRRRFQLHYSKSNDAKHIRNFYSDAIDYFKDFEFAYLIKCIYFENNAEALLKDLAPKLLRSVPAKFQDDFQFLHLLAKCDRDNFIDEYLSALFQDKLGLKLSTSSTRDDSNNPEANKLSEWLGRCLRSESIDKDVALVLFHFIKYWHQTYAITIVRYRNYNKNVVLLTKMLNSYKALEPSQIKFNLAKCVNFIRAEVSDLLPAFISTPYIDSAEKALARDKSVITGYLVKLQELDQVLAQNEMLFKDMTKLSWTQLFEGHCAASNSFKHLYLGAIRHRVKAGVLPNSDDLNFFSDYKNYARIKNRASDADVFKYIVRANYLFTYLDR